MLQAMPINKKSSFDNWDEFKDKLICDFGNIDAFRREAHNQFLQLEQSLESMWELVEHLALQVKTLESTIECLATFPDPWTYKMPFFAEK